MIANRECAKRFVSASSQTVKKMVVLGIGNILLDVMVTVKDELLMDKYEVQKDSQKELNDADMKLLMKDISNLDTECKPGGAAQNTMRVLQWILNVPKSTFMVGAIGKDDQGRQIRSLVEKDGVTTHFIEIDEEPTGKAIALILGATRTLIANIGASMKISMEQIVNDDDINCSLDQSKILYMEGFFISNRFEIAKHFLDYAKANKKVFVFNISAPYLSDMFPEDIKYFVENCDILFGNVNEYQALCKAYNINTVDKLFDELCLKYKNEKELEFDKILVMTNGSKSVLCTHSKNKKEVVDVPKIEKSKIKDTVGAGDSFVAGFLGALCFGKDPAIALKWGCRSAREIIQQPGCSIPPYSSNFLKDVN